MFQFYNLLFFIVYFDYYFKVKNTQLHYGSDIMKPQLKMLTSHLHNDNKI